MGIFPPNYNKKEKEKKGEGKLHIYCLHTLNELNLILIIVIYFISCASHLM